MLDEDFTTWAQYKELIELHKFYFEHLVQTAGFSFGVIGAVFAYVIKARLKATQVRLALVVPLLLSLATSIVFGIGIDKNRDFSAKVQTLQSQLGLIWRPHAEILEDMAIVFTIIFSFISIGLLAMIIYPKVLPSARTSS